jgi:hypothetical protein
MRIDERMGTADRPLADAANVWTLLELNGHDRLKRVLEDAVQEQLVGQARGIRRSMAVDRTTALRVRVSAALAALGDLARRFVIPSSGTRMG